MLLNKQQVYLKAIMPAVSFIFCVCLCEDIFEKHCQDRIPGLQVRSERSNKLVSRIDFAPDSCFLNLLRKLILYLNFFFQIQKLSNVCGATLPRMPTDR